MQIASLNYLFITPNDQVYAVVLSQSEWPVAGKTGSHLHKLKYLYSDKY